MTSNFLRPEDYDLEAEESTNSGQSGVRTTSVTTQSFVELQVLKQKDWRLLIQNDTNPDFLQVLEFVADTRKKASKNAQRKKHTKHGLQGSEQWAVEDDLAALAFSKMETKSTRSALSLASLVRNSNFIKSPLSPVTSSTSSLFTPTSMDSDMDASISRENSWGAAALRGGRKVQPDSGRASPV